MDIFTLVLFIAKRFWHKEKTAQILIRVDRHNITKVELIVAGYQALLDHYGPKEQQNNE